MATKYGLGKEHSVLYAMPGIETTLHETTRALVTKGCENAVACFQAVWLHPEFPVLRQNHIATGLYLAVAASRMPNRPWPTT